MQFTLTSIFALAALSSFAAAAPGPEPKMAVTPRAALIATNAYAACNCPNNCSHKAGSSCRYYGGVSDNSAVVSGKCTNVGGSLTCE